MPEHTDWIIAGAALVQALFAAALLLLIRKEHRILTEQAKAIQKQADAQRESADLQNAANVRADEVAKAQLKHFEMLRPKAAIWDVTYDSSKSLLAFRIATTAPGGDVIEEIEAHLASGHAEPYGDSWAEVEDGLWDWTSLFHRERSGSNDLLLVPGKTRYFEYKLADQANLDYLFTLDQRSVPIESDFVYVVLVVTTALGARAQSKVRKIQEPDGQMVA